MQSRRNFIGNVATGWAGISVRSGDLLGANDRIGVGIVGYGDRGRELGLEVSICTGAEIVGVSDVYERRLSEAKARFPEARMHGDLADLLADPRVDAVVITTPQHLHARQFLAAISAGKHVYVEKTMAFTLHEAKQIRAALARDGCRPAVQIGHQVCSSGQVADATQFLGKGQVGKITAIRGQMYRNTPHGKPQWTRPVYPDMTARSIRWEEFDGGAPFSADRFANWRLFHDYSGGNVYENMSQQIAFWYKVLGLDIPRSVTMTGGIFLWKDGRDVPDTMQVSMTHAEELLFQWDSGFGNNEPGISEQVLGTDGTIVRGQQIRYLPQKVNRRHTPELLGTSATRPRAHMDNFFDCIRSGRESNCPFEIGFRVSVACQMAVESYRQGRTVKWNPHTEEIS